MDKNDFFFEKKSKSHSCASNPKQIVIKKTKTDNMLQDLLEEDNEEEISEEEDIQNLSFSLSNCDDMNNLLDNFSNKSEEKIEVDYESTTNEEGFGIIEDFLKDSTKQIILNKKGFDEDIKKMSNTFYNDLIKNVNINVNLNVQKEKNIKPHYVDNTKNTNYITKSESINSEENTLKFKNDNKHNIGQNYAYGKITSLNSKNKSTSNDKNSSEYISEEEVEEDKIIEIKKKEVEKNLIKEYYKDE